MRAIGIITGVLAVLLLAACGQADDRRNPFGVPDVQDPDGQDAQNLAESVKLAGDANDPNAEQWARKETRGKKGSLDGEWSNRWNGNDSAWHYGAGPTRIKEIGDRVYMLVHASNGKYLLDLKRTKNRLVGKYQGIDEVANDTGPCVLLIVDDERIDGNWAGLGRWDFRRKLKQ